MPGRSPAILKLPTEAFVQGEILVESILRQTATPARIKRLSEIDPVSCTNNRLVIERVGKPEPGTQRLLEWYLGITSAVTGCSKLVS